MLQQGWSTEWLAKAARVPLGTLRTAIAAEFRHHPRVKLRLENALNQPFWTSQEELQTRHQLGRLFFEGQDPWLIPVEEVRKIVFRHGISYFRKTKRRLLAELLDQAKSTGRIKTREARRE